MSGEGPESIPTSADPRSRRPTKKRALTPVSAQAASVDALFARPDQNIRIPDASSAVARRAAPPEIVANVQGSSAGAGSGEFHVYKAARRREYERLKEMDQAVKSEKDHEEFEKNKSEKEQKDNEKTRKNREKREKMKARKAKKGKGGGDNDIGNGAGGTSTPPAKKAINGTATTQAQTSDDDKNKIRNEAKINVTEKEGKSSNSSADIETTTNGTTEPGIIFHDDDD